MQQFAQVFHFPQRGRDQTADSDNICLVFFGSLNNTLIVNHDTKVDYVQIITGQNNIHDIFTDVVYVSFHRGNHDTGAAGYVFARCVVTFDFRLQDVYGFFHNLG